MTGVRTPQGRTPVFALDAKTGEPLEWRGKPLDDNE